jgi:hypothetical protein
MTTNEVLCSNCRYSFCIEYGYSNYTVEGSDLYCVADFISRQGVDRFWNEEPVLQEAETCPWWTKIDVEITFDVDLINNWLDYFDDEDASRRILITNWIKRNKDRYYGSNYIYSRFKEEL